MRNEKVINCKKPTVKEAYTAIIRQEVAKMDEKQLKNLAYYILTGRQK